MCLASTPSELEARVGNGISPKFPPVTGKIICHKRGHDSITAIMQFSAFFVAAALALLLPLTTSHNVDHSGRTAKRYIVKLKSEANISSVCEETNTKTIYEYKFINGFAATLNENELDKLRDYSGVEYIEEDTFLNLTAIVTQHDASWGLGRLGTRVRLADQNPNHENFTFNYHSSAGEGAIIYVLDTGVSIEHDEFGGRASYGTSFDNSGPTDVNGHGTHVAGIAAGSRFGVAKQANIVSVKVSNDEIAGMSWVWDTVTLSPSTPSIALIALDTFASEPIDDAVAAIDRFHSPQQMTSIGIHVVVPAGNFGVDAASISPARAPSAVTVGATDITDSRASFSNHGCVVDIFAPGEDIPGASAACRNGYLVESGTSMAAAYVAGLIASLISESPAIAWTPELMKTFLKQLAVDGILTNIPFGTDNLLAVNGFTT
ncbi:hypothetical protein H0H93_005604 [Arthromyces matolae]|nr:hypothetical protein H0H93_005604 [Arthromyces matolae]